MYTINGAKWWKFDFHNHSPSSYDYGRDDHDEKKISPRDWLLKYMEKEIDCIAITDHNSGDFIDSAKIAYLELENEQPEGFRKLHIFPGVELTVNTGIHLLAIFDITATSNTIANILGACRYPIQNGSNCVTTESLENVIAIVTKNNGVAIPAHVDVSNGLFVKQEGNTLNQTLIANRDNLLALEVVDLKYEFPDIFDKSELSLSKIIGSDSHKAIEIGRKYTWVKMSVPSIEALKLALHDGEDCTIRYDEIDTATNPNEVKNRYYINSLTINNGYRIGNKEPLDAFFSPWLTSLIGGRGTGKSTLINFIRILFDRTSGMPADIQEDFNQFNQVGSRTKNGMLRDSTSISARIIKDGKLQRLTWNGKHTFEQWNSENNCWNKPYEISNIQELFPLQIFSQKELFALTNQPNKILELIDSQFDKSEWLRKKNELEDKWFSIRAEKRKLMNAATEQSNLRVELQTVNNRLKLYQSNEYQSILKDVSSFISINNSISRFESDIKVFRDKLQLIRGQIPILQFEKELSKIFDNDTLDYVKDIDDFMDTSREQFFDIVTNIDQIKSELQDKIKENTWYKTLEKSQEEFLKLSQQIQKSGSESFTDLLQKKETIIEQFKKIKKQKLELAKTLYLADDLYKEIIDHEKELRRKRKEIIDSWNIIANLDKPMLKVELSCMGNADDAEDSFRNIIRKNEQEFQSSIYFFDEETNQHAGLIGEIVNTPEEDRWTKREEIIKGLLPGPQCENSYINKRFLTHIKNLFSKTPEDIDRLLIWIPEDQITLYFKKGAKFVNIGIGSAGERTAGMLGLLLNLENVPLIIDQPEDDLDTSLISDFVVRGFKSIKKNRQIVVVTHNPNIAVNANSDNILHMDFSEGQVRVVNNDALQSKPIREAVCTVMEGGRDALNKRYYRISKALK
jgi:ABC-type enterochelin transport system ATPase subunit